MKTLKEIYIDLLTRLYKETLEGIKRTNSGVQRAKMLRETVNCFSFGIYSELTEGEEQERLREMHTELLIRAYTEGIKVAEKISDPAEKVDFLHDLVLFYSFRNSKDIVLEERKTAR